MYPFADREAYFSEHKTGKSILFSNYILEQVTL